MLFDAQLPNKLWPEAINHANGFAIAYLPTGSEAPSQILHGTPTQESTTAICSSLAPPGYAYIHRSDTAKVKKLLPRAMFGYFIGFASEPSLIKIYIPQTKKIKIVRRSDFRKAKNCPLLGGRGLTGRYRKTSRQKKKNWNPKEGR